MATSDAELVRERDVAARELAEQRTHDRVVLLHDLREGVPVVGRERAADDLLGEKPHGLEPRAVAALFAGHLGALAFTAVALAAMVVMLGAATSTAE